MTVMSIDGSYMLHRARFVAEKNDKVSRDNIVLLFMRSLLTEVDQFSPSKIYVYFDKGRSAHRMQILEAYKAQRIKDPNCPIQQAYDASRDFLHSKLPTLGFISVLEEGIEADDFAYLVAYQQSPGVHISDDKDWFLNLFPGWHLFRAKAGELHSFEDLCKMVEDYEKPRLIYLITRCMVGDKSDNIPGVRGIGWQSAATFAPKIIYKEDLGTSHKAKLVEKGMDIVRRNMCVMNPSWILHSEEAKCILAEAEQTCQKITEPMAAWRAFSGQLDSHANTGLWAWWNKYNKAIRSINNAA